MPPEDYRDFGIGLLSGVIVFGVIGCLLLLRDPSGDQLGITLASNGSIYPTYNFELQGIWRLLVGWISIGFSSFFGLGMLYFFYLYIDYKRRS